MFGLRGLKESCPVAAFENGDQNLELTPGHLHLKEFRFRNYFGQLSAFLSVILEPLTPEVRSFIDPTLRKLKLEE